MQTVPVRIACTIRFPFEASNPLHSIMKYEHYMLLNMMHDIIHQSVVSIYRFFGLVSDFLLPLNQPKFFRQIRSLSQKSI